MLHISFNRNSLFQQTGMHILLYVMYSYAKPKVYVNKVTLCCADRKKNVPQL